MQYTLRNVPDYLDRALREKAKREFKSLNQVTIEALKLAMGMHTKPIRYRDLSNFCGTGVWDPIIDEALADQRRIDPKDWR